VTTETGDPRVTPEYEAPPGHFLAELLEKHGMTQTQLASRLGVSVKHVNQIVNGGASVSAEIALGLEKVFGLSAAFWLNRTALYQADIARRAERLGLEKAVGWANRFPITELKNRGFLPRDAHGPELVAALLHFFGIASPKQWSDPIASFRKSQKLESDPHALSAWLRVGELQASSVKCQPYHPDDFLAALEDIRPLTLLEPQEWHPRLVELSARGGVAIVIVDTFRGARANGATRWLSPIKALVQLSLRYRWEDIFWFTLFHEAGHVVLHPKKEIFVEPAHRPAGDQADTEWLRFEREADRFAARELIPPRYDRQLRRLTLNDVPAFAERLGIPSAIVIGRLQHEGLLPYNRGNNLRRRFTFAD
jgi:HTH-type transcriptional regulator / antitoxin HigA